MTPDGSSEYDRLAPRYVTLFEQPERIGRRDLDLLGEYAGVDLSKCDVLDCSCGIGITVLALSGVARSVTGSDASQGMLDQARLLCQRHGVDVPLIRANWSSLRQAVDNHFDLVLCLGNSIAHCSGVTEMTSAIQNMANVLRPGGTLIVDSRNWESLIQDDLTYQALRARRVDESVVVPVYRWNLKDIGVRSTVDLVWLTVDRDNAAELEVHTLSFTPFARKQLLEIVTSELGGSTRVIEYERDHYWIAATRTVSADA